MILPPFVGAIGLKQIFGQYGAFNALLIDLHLQPAGWTFDWFAVSQFWGVALVEALSLYPIIYLNAVAALANIDPAMEEAAENLGCTGLRRFRRITLPLINPGLFAGATIVFIWTFTELGVPLIFDYDRVMSVQIYSRLEGHRRQPVPVCAGGHHAREHRAALRPGQGPVRPRQLRDDGQGHERRRGARPCRRRRAWLCTGALSPG